MSRRRPETISPTAHYTGTVWLQNGLSHPAFATLQGQAYYLGLKLPLALSARLGGPTLDSFLLARHRLIDRHLTDAIEEGRITQVIEIASGLSPRGWRFCERYRDRIRYIETDLPAMAQSKEQLLRDGGLDREWHEVRPLNALIDDGPDSLAALAARLDPNQGTAIITEGLINYFDTATVQALWTRIARTLSGFPYGLYLSDLHLNPRQGEDLPTRLFMRGLSTFVRGRVHLHHASESVAEAALREAGFTQTEVIVPSRFGDRIPDCRTPGADRVRVVRACTWAPS